MDPGEERFIRAITKVISKPQVDLPTYKGGLNVEELLDWINKMDKYFKFENIEEEQKVKFSRTKLKGHASLWWDHVQTDRK